MKTYFQSKESAELNRKWFVVDLAGVPLGRAASKIASVLRGKEKPTFTPHNDGGDFVIAINADKVVLTGSKPDTKIYYKHTGYIGNMKTWTGAKLLQEKPEHAVMLAVKGMLPKNSLGRNQVKKLKVFTGTEHVHSAQNPEILTIKR